MSPYDLNLRHLLAVRAIARLGGVSHACAAVHLSQPALTQALVKLERALGQRLFDRRPNGMTPTVAGLELVDRVDRAARELTAGFAALRARGGRGDPEALLRQTSLTHLRAVIAAVDSGNFVLATRATGLSSPAIHRAVRDFERLTGVSLFERRGRTVRPTRAARALVAAARRAIAEIEAALADLGAATNPGGGRVAIGAMPLARAELAPQAVAAFLREYPAAAVKIVDGAYAELMARLLGGDVDLLIGALREPNPSPEVVQQPLYDDQLAVIARAGHPLAGRRVEPRDLAAYPWIMAQRGTPMRDVWAQVFAGAGLAQPAVSIECSSVLAIHGLLMEGDWLTLLSPAQVSREVAAGRLVVLDIAIAGGARTIGTTVRAGWRPSVVQARFLDHLTAKASIRANE
jgi:LysR family transcriptional regulator, regulator for genes of the gallate degradation pathway